jgi:histone acetyltransferase
MERLKQLSNSTVVYKGIQEFKEGAERIDVAALPGLIESGWDPKPYVISCIAEYHTDNILLSCSYLELTSEENQKKLEEEHLALIDKIKQDMQLSWPFLEPVPLDVPMYYEVIKDPIGKSNR